MVRLLLPIILLAGDATALVPATTHQSVAPTRAAPAVARAMPMVAVETREGKSLRSASFLALSKFAVAAVQPLKSVAGPLKIVMRPFTRLFDLIRRRARSDASIKDALLTAELMRRTSGRIAALNLRNLAENHWEDSLLPAVGAARRNLAEVGWEARLLPAIDLGGPRRDLAEVSWEDRILPGPVKRVGRATRDLAGWERLLPTSGGAAALPTSHSLDESGWEDRFLP